MIFVTVGTQVPFDRLVRTVDDWAGQAGRTDVFAQIGPSSLSPRHIESKRFLHPDEFRKLVENAETIIAHAGMGSIITALEFGKRIIVMPRRCGLHEHRNDHQLATAKRLSDLGLVQAVSDEAELLRELCQIRTCTSVDRLSIDASPQLLGALRAFIEHGTMPVHYDR